MAQPGRRGRAVAEHLAQARLGRGGGRPRERAERIAVAAELQQVRGQSKEREAELAALRAQLVTSERAEKRGR